MFENKFFKNEMVVVFVLVEWDCIFVLFEDFYGLIVLYSNVDFDEVLCKVVEDCEIKIS